MGLPVLLLSDSLGKYKIDRWSRLDKAVCVSSQSYTNRESLAIAFV